MIFYKRILIANFLLATFFLSSCNSPLQVSSSNNTIYKISQSDVQDSATLKMIQPYHDSLSLKMDVVISVSEIELTKVQPEGTLGNFCADAMMNYVRDILYQQVDISLINNGGFRLPSLPKGNITVGKIYELLPFENQMVLQKISGADVQLLCDLIASKGGWPVSGITFKIENGKASQIKIGNENLRIDKMYDVLSSDYLANGGDDLTMLKKYSYLPLNITMRNAMLAYLEYLMKSGKKINSTIEGRIYK
jgi:2',3'-cyclic-nucleotide 2'-phosphodiesterase (5'-nucleotidase family)